MVALAAASCTLCAQTKVFPAAATKAGNTSSFPPFVVDGGVLQEIISGPKISTKGANLTGLEMRAAPGNTVSGRKIPRLIIRIGHTARSPATMSTVLKANRTAAMTTVFDGAWVLPSQTTTTKVGPWNIAWRWARPFVFKNTSGNLLIEIEMPGPAKTKFRYSVDSFVSGTMGSHRSFGTKGRFVGGDRFNMFSSLDQLRPGGEAVMRVVNLKKGYPALAVYGFSRTKWGPIKLPFDLKGLGAPTNSLQVSMDILLPVAPWKIAPGLWNLRAVLTVPNLATLAGKKFYGQTLFLDPPSNALGLVFSNATEMTLGKGSAADAAAVHSLDTKLGFGGFVNTGRSGGPVLRLTGSFQ